MTTIRNTLAAGLSFAAVLMSVALVSAQTGSPAPTPDPAVLKQIEEMQKQLDALKAQVGVVPEAKAGSAGLAATPKSENSAAGVKMAEGWVGRAYLTKTIIDQYGSPTELGGLEDEPLKAFVVKDSAFPLSKLAEATKSLPQGKPYGYNLQGYFEAKKDGKYGFSIEMTANVPERGAKVGNYLVNSDQCSTAIKIEDQPVIEQLGKVGRYQETIYSIAGSGSVTLSPGIYKIDATINCMGRAYHQAFDANWSLKVREPDAMEPSVPKAGFLMHKQAKSS
ncbi:hypothetical protein [Microvirga splendida]|uniref:Uncharacterized protein n=1 Tax=Microvirga splendida TaxID=2795727 RepID=A0ABS0Y4Q8_9HYPH|nr:hypothetical protein [Microvirga splendida]MBJ6126905.1 hypothetical protein [Microvirga splendida]